VKKNKLIEKVQEFVETDGDSSTMGYNHYWHREEAIESSLFEKIAFDFERLILPLEDAGVRLAGYDGRGLPQIDHSGIVFNGVEECGHPQNPDIYIPFPCDTASGIGSSGDAIYSSSPLFVELKRRTCNGVCRCESFNLPRRVDRRWHKPDENGRYFYSCKTAFKPYDLAVQSVLLICKRHLGDCIVVSSGGSDFHWNDPRRFCFVHLGYRLNEFTIVRDQGLVPTEQAGPDFNPNGEPLL
jgi:hypothetical protein